MIFNETAFKDKLKANGIDVEKVKVTFTHENTYLNGGGRVTVISDKMQIYTSGAKYPVVCSSGMLYSYGMYRTYDPNVPHAERSTGYTEAEKKHARIIINAILSTFGPNDYPVVGGWIAANPLDSITETHFLALGGFVPLMGWANSYHGKRGTMVWLKQMAIPAEDKDETITERQITELRTKKKTLANLFPKESVEVKKEEPVVKIAAVSPDSTRARDEKGRFITKPCYNVKIQKGIRAY